MPHFHHTDLHDHTPPPQNKTRTQDMTTPLLGSLAYFVGLMGADLALLPVLGIEGAG